MKRKENCVVSFNTFNNTVRLIKFVKLCVLGVGVVVRRNQNYVSILRFLNLGDKKLNPFDITHRFTHLFWLGDLNYRLEMQSSVSISKASDL